MRTETQKYLDACPEVAVQTTAIASVGYLCARAFLYIEPVHAALFSAATFLVAKLISPSFEKTFGGWGASDDSKMIGNLLGLVTAVAFSSAISTMAGFPVTFTGGMALICTIAATAIFGAMALGLAQKNAPLMLN